ncbi:MAG: hypothetical protein JO057_20080, partial [Chloroflexi bacterium]|nr:hypothetical protein [Chloroflexota bacterium]
MNRRALIRGSAFAGAGTLLASSLLPTSVGAQAAPATPAATPAATAHDMFFKDEDLNFNFLVMLGFARYGLVDVGSALAVADRITDGNAASAVQALTDAGDQFAAIGDAALAAGHTDSARSAYLQASVYAFTATYFLDSMGAPERFAPLWRQQQALWDKGAALLDSP